MQQALIDIEMMQTPVDVTKVVTNQFVKEAVELAATGTGRRPRPSVLDDEPISTARFSAGATF
jgi:hypothetical protein